MLLMSAGCSFIYGTELSDSPDWRGSDPPSSLTWPALYAREQGWDYHTAAVCGISNRGIARYVMDRVWALRPDLVTVQWSFLERSEVRFNRCDLDHNDSFYYGIDPFQSTDIDPGQRWAGRDPNLSSVIEQFSTFWYRHCDDDLSQFYHYLQSRAMTAMFLEYLGIPYVFTDTDTPRRHLLSSVKDPSLRTLEDLDRRWPSISFQGMGFHDWAHQRGLPVGQFHHPLDQAHSVALDLIRPELDRLLAAKTAK